MSWLGQMRLADFGTGSRQAEPYRRGWAYARNPSTQSQKDFDRDKFFRRGVPQTARSRIAFPKPFRSDLSNSVALPFASMVSYSDAICKSSFVWYIAFGHDSPNNREDRHSAGFISRLELKS